MRNEKTHALKTLNFYNDDTYRQLTDRIAKLEANASRKWGKMSNDQMLHHLNIAIGSGLGFYELKDVSMPLISPLLKWYVLRVSKSFLKGTPTSGTLKVKGERYDFDAERDRLFEILAKAKQTRSDGDWRPHTLFGPLTRKEWGELICIHVDHHMKQFGV